VTRSAKTVVSYIDSTSTFVGKFAMYLVLVMMGILVYQSISRTVFNHPNIWAVEMTEFVMTAYYFLGGGYSHIIDSHVRMDILYQRLSLKNKAIADIITFPAIAFYLIVLLIGGIKGSLYAVVYHQKTYTAWAPPESPIKIIMTAGIALMLLQVISELIKDFAQAKGEALERMGRGGELR